MWLQLLPLLIAIPAAVIMLADNAFRLAVVVTVSIAIVSVVATFAGGQLAALGGVVAIGGGYLTDWPPVMQVAAAAYWLAVLLALFRERAPQPIAGIGKLRRWLTSCGATPAQLLRVLAFYPWVVSCVAFKRYSIDYCFSTSDDRPVCSLTFLEFSLWVCPLLLALWELFTLESEE